MKTNLLDFWNRIAGYFLLILAIASLAILASCSTLPRTESDVLRQYGTPSSIIPDSGWRVLHYVSPDKTTNDFGIWGKTGAVFFHSNF